MRTKMDRFDGESAEVRLLVEKYQTRVQAKFHALGTVEATNAAIEAFFTDKRKFTLLMVQLKNDSDLLWGPTSPRMLVGTLLAKLLDRELLETRQWKPSTGRLVHFAYYSSV